MKGKNSLIITLLGIMLVALLTFSYWQGRAFKDNGNIGPIPVVVQTPITAANSPISAQTTALTETVAESTHQSHLNTVSPVAAVSAPRNIPAPQDMANVSNPISPNINNSPEETAPVVNVANPIPSNAVVSQRINEQNQRYDNAYAILAQHQAMAAMVVHANEASRNQRIVAQNIPAPYTGPAPDNVVAKIKNNDVMASH